MNVNQVSVRFFVREDDQLMVKITVHLKSGEEQSVTTEVDAETITMFLDLEEQKAVGTC